MRGMIGKTLPGTDKTIVAHHVSFTTYRGEDGPMILSYVALRDPEGVETVELAGLPPKLSMPLTFARDLGKGIAYQLAEMADALDRTRTV